MSLDSYNFIKENLHRIDYESDSGIITTPRGTNGTVCSSSGYLRVKVNGKLLQVHQILAVVYYGEACIGKQINHKDGNKLNNHKDNLEVCTQKENIAHGWETGLYENSMGVLHPNAKLKSEDVIYIRNSDKSNKELAEIFKVHSRRILDVKKRVSYKNII